MNYEIPRPYDFNPRTHRIALRCDRSGMWEEVVRKDPTRLQGLFILHRRKFWEGTFERGEYYYSTLAVSRLFGYKSDVFGKWLRETRGTEEEGIASIRLITFITAKEAYKRGVLRFFKDRDKFSWLDEEPPMDNKFVFKYGLLQ